MTNSNMSSLISGAFVFWDAVTTSHSLIARNLDDIGLGLFTPSRRTPTEALAKALKDYGEKHITGLAKVTDEKVKRTSLVQPRLAQESNGLELLTVTRKVGPNDYENVIAAKVDPLTDVVTVTDGWANVWDLQDAYNVYRAECSGSQVGQSLVAILKHYHATCVRAAGGLYYLPDDVVDAWDLVTKAFKSACNKNAIHRTRIVLDECAVESVRTAISLELTKAAGEIAEELRTISTDKAIEARKAKVAAIRYKADKYKAILSDDLIEVDAVLSMADVALAAAVAVDDNSQVFDGILD